MIQRSSWLYLSLWTWCSAVVSVLAFKSGGGKHYLQLHFFTILTVSTSLHQTANNSLHAAHSSSGGCCMIQVWSLIAGVSVDRVRPSESWKVSSNKEWKKSVKPWWMDIYNAVLLLVNTSILLLLLTNHHVNAQLVGNRGVVQLPSGFEYRLDGSLLLYSLMFICHLETRKL